MPFISTGLSVRNVNFIYVFIMDCHQIQIIAYLSQLPIYLLCRVVEDHMLPRELRILTGQTVAPFGIYINY